MKSFNRGAMVRRACGVDPGQAQGRSALLRSSRAAQAALAVTVREKSTEIEHNEAAKARGRVMRLLLRGMRVPRRSDGDGNEGVMRELDLVQGRALFGSERRNLSDAWARCSAPLEPLARHVLVTLRAEDRRLVLA